MNMGIAVIHIGRLIRTNDSSLLVDPYSRWNIHHVVELGNQMLLVDQDRVGGLGLCLLNPDARVLHATSILRNRDNFKITILQLFVDCLPAWQIVATTSPGGPGNQQDLLSTKIGERALNAGGIRQGKVGSFERSDLFTLIGALAKAPGGPQRLEGHGLREVLGKSDQVEPCGVLESSYKLIRARPR